MKRRYIVEESVSSATTRVFHPRTSKPNNSKHTELTNSQLYGIGASVVLSFVIAASGIGLTYILFPYLLDAVQYIVSFQFLKSLFETSPNLLSLQAITLESFESEFFNIKPVIFLSPDISVTDRKDMMDILNKEYKSFEYSLHKLTALDDGFVRDDVKIGTVAKFLGARRPGSRITLPRYRDQPLLSGNDYEYDDLLLVDDSALSRMPKLQKYLVTPTVFSVEVDGPIKTKKTSLSEKLKNIGHRVFGGKTENKRTFHNKETSTKDKVKLFTDSRFVFSAINKDKGMSFHQTEHSWQILISGKLRWALYKSDEFPRLGFNPAESYKQWFDSVYPALWQRQLPIEVIQEAGEVLYIPEGWYRGYFSESENSVLVSQVTNYCESSSAFCNYLEAIKREKQNDPESAIGFLKQGLQSSLDAKLLLKLGKLQMQIQDYVDAEDTLKQAIGKSYRNPQGYIQLVQLLHTMERVGMNRSVTDVTKILQLGRRVNISSQCEEFQRLVVKYEI